MVKPSRPAPVAVESRYRLSLNSAQTVLVPDSQRSGDKPVAEAAKHYVEDTYAHKMRKWHLTPRTVAESLWISCMSEWLAMKTIFGHGPARRNLQRFCTQTTAST